MVSSLSILCAHVDVSIGMTRVYQVEIIDRRLRWVEPGGLGRKINSGMPVLRQVSLQSKTVTAIESSSADSRHLPVVAGFRIGAHLRLFVVKTLSTSVLWCSIFAKNSKTLGWPLMDYTSPPLYRPLSLPLRKLHHILKRLAVRKITPILLIQRKRIPKPLRPNVAPTQYIVGGLAA